MAFSRFKSVSGSVRELEIKRKTPILKGFIVIILVLVPILAVSDFLTGDILFGLIETGLVALFGVCYFFLRKGRYLAVSVVSSAFVWLALAFIGYSGQVDGPLSVFRVVVMLLGAVAFASFFLIDRLAPLLLSAANVAIITLFFLFRVRAPLLGGEFGNIFIVAQAFNFLLLFLVIKQTALGRSIAEDLEKEKEKGEKRISAIEDAAARSESNLRSLDVLAARVEDIRSAVESNSRAISAIVKGLGELDSAADGVTLEAGSIGERMRDLNGHIESESAAQVESAASVNEMVASIGSVADSVKKRREVIRELIGTTEEGEARLKGLLGIIDRVEGYVGDVKQMVNVINKIASSTNLLAMNASIEAAHAGDSGRGFSVVAEEIRGLAENAARNAKDIGQKLKEVISSITEAAGQSEPMKAAFGKIRTGIDETITSFDEIKSATGELSEGGRQILESIKILNDTSTGVRDGGSAILSAQGRLLELQRRAKDAVQSVSREVDSVAERNRGLLDAAEAVSGVVSDGAKRAEELHAAMRAAEALKAG